MACPSEIVKRVSAPLRSDWDFEQLAPIGRFRFAGLKGARRVPHPAFNHHTAASALP